MKNFTINYIIKNIYTYIYIYNYNDNEERLKTRSDQMKIIIPRSPINSINEAH